MITDSLQYREVSAGFFSYKEYYLVRKRKRLYLVSVSFKIFLSGRGMLSVDVENSLQPSRTTYGIGTRIINKIQKLMKQHNKYTLKKDNRRGSHGGKLYVFPNESIFFA